MADTWDTPEHLRPRARPDSVAPEPVRPALRPEGLGQVPDGVQEAATEPGKLPLDRLALLGLFNGPDGSSALVRLASGSVVKVAQGASLDGGRVTAISEDGLRLQKDGREIILTMPV